MVRQEFPECIRILVLHYVSLKDERMCCRWKRPARTDALQPPRYSRLRHLSNSGPIRSRASCATLAKRTPLSDQMCPVTCALPAPAQRASILKRSHSLSVQESEWKWTAWSRLAVCRPPSFAKSPVEVSVGMSCTNPACAKCAGSTRAIEVTGKKFSRSGSATEAASARIACPTKRPKLPRAPTSLLGPWRAPPAAPIVPNTSTLSGRQVAALATSRGATAGSRLLAELLAWGVPAEALPRPPRLLRCGN
mmetsp:Transcript_3841/g.8070  ORF Transcript_3841/g.8070 Transcript_3841/m.8070 type:complete len:250 (+) Transcript_3841:35-784(+)